MKLEIELEDDAFYAAMTQELMEAAVYACRYEYRVAAATLVNYFGTPSQIENFLEGKFYENAPDKPPVASLNVPTRDTCATGKDEKTR